MTIGNKFAEALIAYDTGSDTETFRSMLHDDFRWESWTKIKFGLQIETKKTTLELFSDGPSSDEVKILLATNAILIIGFRGEAYGSILFTYEFKDGVAIKAFSARGETP